VIRILGAKSPGELRIAVMNGDELEAYTIWRPGAPDGFGDIHAGRVTARVPAMAGAFVALDGATGFLPDTEGAAALSDGDAVLVRVSRAAQGDKGPRLARVVPDAGKDVPAIGLVRRGPSPLHRLAAYFATAEIYLDDPAVVARLRGEDFFGRIRLVQGAFDDALESDIDALAAPWATLPGGIKAGFFPTPALTAIDMDGAATTGNAAQKSAAQFAANRAALPGLARQIRLRNLSGAILVDFAGIAIKRRSSLSADFSSALAADPARPRLLGFTALGLAEIVRPRTTPPLHELLAGPHAAGLLALREMARIAGGNAAASVALRAAPRVVTALQADSAALQDFADIGGRPPALRSDPTLPMCGWVIENAS
jgi:Ribonuclease G/E